MAIVRCISLASSPVLTEITSSTTPSFRKASGTRTCHPSVLPTSFSLKYGLVEGKPFEQFHSNFLPNNTGSLFIKNLVPAKKSVGMLIQAQRVNFKATRTVTIPFKERALPANEYLKETERIVKVTFPDSSRIEYMGDKTWRSRLRPITFINVTATPILEERMDVSRRHALLAALAFTIPSSQIFQPQRDSQALAVDDEKMKIELIQYELKKVLTKGKSAGVLRLAFHDAGTFDSSDNLGGMNGSILFELDRPESAGLQRPIKVLQKVKRELDLAFPVSWADLIAVAGAAAVAECDGPVIPITLGRLDSSRPDPEGKMPEETLSASDLKQAFQSKGFTTQELVALSGAHTIGNKGFGNPNLFDNSYFQILLQKPWKIAGPDDGMTSMIGLATDRALADDEECSKWLKVYAADQGRFFTDFAAVYTKLVNTGARWGPSMQA